MRTLQIALAAWLATAAGCQSNTGQVLVEQEARVLEDEVYRLEAQLDECCRMAEATKRENEDLRKQLADAGGSSGGYRAPTIELPKAAAPSKTPAPKLEPPKVELPEPSDKPPANLIPGDQEPQASGLKPARLSINPRLTGGFDHDGAGGDEGINLLVEPRDELGCLAPRPGAVSVVLMDPAQTGDDARLARWDFQTHEFDNHFQNATFARGLQYELKWPGEPPRNRDLMVFVRYTGEDGTKLTADAPVRIRLASDAPRTVSATDEDLADEPSSKKTERRPLQHARGERPEWKPYR
jgi:hypothetical protein